MRRFAIYFIVIFLISFSVLNSRFVSAQVDFWLNRPPAEVAIDFTSKSQRVNETSAQGAGNVGTGKGKPCHKKISLMPILLLPTFGAICQDKVIQGPPIQHRGGEGSTLGNFGTGTANSSLEIPSLGIRAPIILEKSADPKIVFKRLEDGVVHYSSSPLPGQKGAAIILGHSSAYPWYKGKFGSVFALLGRLENGDRIIINGGGETLVYEVKESLIFNPFAKNPGLERLAATDGSSIILVSCWPVGTNYKRIAIKADLI